MTQRPDQIIVITERGGPGFLVFISDVACALLGLPELFVVNAVGSGLRRVVGNVGGTPAWREIP